MSRGLACLGFDDGLQVQSDSGHMKNNATIDSSKKYCFGLLFEREGFFRLIQQNCYCREVLYLERSTHITPLLFFPYLVHVHGDPIEKDFFVDFEAVLDYIQTTTLLRPKRLISMGPKRTTE